MKEYGPTTFGDLNADEYDALHDPGTTEESVELIAELAGDGAILELAIGTGRMALPLAQRGLNISGFDASPDMLAKLAAKPGGAAIPAWIAEMASFELGQRFDFAFLVFNTLYNLTTQEAQVQCFQRVAAHLNPGGRFLVEAFMPTPNAFATLMPSSPERSGLTAFCWRRSITIRSRRRSTISTSGSARCRCAMFCPPSST